MDKHSRTPKSRSRLASGIALIAGAALLAGCGGGAKQAAPQAQGDRYIFISAKDCAESGKLDLQRCGDAIDAAIATHLSTAPTYKSLYNCEKAEGLERCERTDDKTFRPRLVAYLVTINAGAATALPLYSGTPDDKGFRQSDKKKVLLVTDDTLTYSQSSIAIYEANRGNGKGTAPKT
jgi:uncharacterized protein YgiB involved in biofilm formation